MSASGESESELLSNPSIVVGVTMFLDAGEEISIVMVLSNTGKCEV